MNDWNVKAIKILQNNDRDYDIQLLESFTTAAKSKYTIICNKTIQMLTCRLHLLLATFPTPPPNFQDFQNYLNEAHSLQQEVDRLLEKQQFDEQALENVNEMVRESNNVKTW